MGDLCTLLNGFSRIIILGKKAISYTEKLFFFHLGVLIILFYREITIVENSFNNVQKSISHIFILYIFIILPLLIIFFGGVSFLQIKYLSFPVRLSFELGVCTIIFSHERVIGIFFSSFSKFTTALSFDSL